ncbi:MAG: methyltransferase [Prevotella sp.]|nr:methyltransferase [Prevotella sp.]
MSSFAFKKFTVLHDKCAMKVGTDGIILGAWANGGKNILDIGTGSGLIALFMAQRFENAKVTAIDIDHESVLQAQENFRNSIFSERISIFEISLQNFRIGKYDAIVCNPPFYNCSLNNPDNRKAIARHTETLTYHDLFKGVSALLTDDGEFSAIIPAMSRTEFDKEAISAGLFPARVCAIKTVEYKPVGRYLLSYKKYPVKQLKERIECLHNKDMTRTEWFDELTRDFYL